MNSISIQFENIKCAIFDFDGVILDSSSIKTECFQKLYRQYNTIYGAAMAYHYENKGMSRFLQFEYVTKKLLKSDNPETMAQKMAENYAEIVFSEVAKAPFIPGAVKLLGYLYKIYPLYIISSGPHDELAKIIAHRGLTKYFKAYYGNVDDKAGYIEKIFINEGFDKNQIIYIGDTLKDLSSARKARVNFCAVRNKLVDFTGQNCMQVSDLEELKNVFCST